MNTYVVEDWYTEATLHYPKAPLLNIPTGKPLMKSHSNRGRQANQ